MYARFGQELYAKETIAAAAILAVESERNDGRALTERIADILPHASPATRIRLATKLLQRMAAGAAIEETRNGRHFSPTSSLLSEPTDLTPVTSDPRAEAPVESRLTAFARLVSHLHDTQARSDLIYYATARADALVGAIARDILYPYFIEDRIPSLFTEDEFILENANLLLAPEPILTTGFVCAYAKRAWGFECERTVTLSLRILRQAGILLPSPLLGERGRVHAYTLAPHGLSLAALLWGLYEEFGQESVTPAWDHVARAGFVRQFVVPTSVVQSRLFEAERAGLVGFWSVGGSRRIVLKVREPQALARLLLSGPDPK